MSTNHFPTGTTSDRSHRDWLLFALTLSSGAVDAISFLALGKIFTAFMTGNIAFLGMAIAGNADAPSIIGVLAAIVGCAVGVYLATTIVTPFAQPVARQGEQPTAAVWPQRATVALAVSLLGHLCFMGIWFALGGRPGEIATFALLIVWALAMGMQSAAVRGLNVGGIFTTAATATFIFVFGDFAHLSGEERRRLVGVLASLTIGATAGGLLLIYAPIYAPVLPFVITLGVVAIAAKAFAYGDSYSVHR
jgi:uncharacterized membrane protein YoaK (UPF0700 family)